VQAAHDLDVEGLEGVAGGLNEEDASVDAVVDNVHPVDLVLSIEVGIEALLDVVDDRAPRLVIVDKVTKAGRVHHSKTKTNTGLLDVGADRLNRDGLGDDVHAGALAFPRRVERRVEEGVDQGRLAETGLANNHNIEIETLTDTLTVPLVGEVGETNVSRQLPPDNVPHVGGGNGRKRRRGYSHLDFGHCDSDVTVVLETIPEEFACSRRSRVSNHVADLLLPLLMSPLLLRLALLFSGKEVLSVGLVVSFLIVLLRG
jgi:hypothetical protein